MADEVARLRIETATDDLNVASQRVERLRGELEGAQKAVNAAGPGWEKQAQAVAKLTGQLEAAERAVKKKQLAVASATQAAERQDQAEAARAQRAIDLARREADRAEVEAKRKADAQAREARRAADAQIREAQRVAAVEQARLAAGPVSLAGGEATEQIMVGARTFRGGMSGGQWNAQKYATDVTNAARANRDFGNAALQASFMVDDLQYGVQGVLNNIPMLTMAFGAGAGVTAGLSITAVAAAQLARHWDDLATAFGTPVVRTAAEEMKYLADMTERTAEQTTRLHDLQAEDARRKATDSGTVRALSIRATEDTQAGEMFGKALAESLVAGQTGQDMRDALAESAIQRQREIDPSRPVDEAAIRAEVERRMGGALAGDAADLTFIRDLAAGQEGMLRRLADMMDRADAAPRQQERADAAANNSANRRRVLESDLSGVQSADEFAIVLDRINAAVRESALTDEDAAALYERAADLRRKALDVEAENVAKIAQINRDRETDELNRQGAENEAAAAPEIEEARQANARRERRRQGRLTAMEEGYGQASAGGLNQAMLAAQGRGEDAGTTDRRLRDQMMAKLANAPLTDEQRLSMAANIVQRQREGFQDFQFQQAMQRDIQRQQIRANLAPAGTTIGVMQRQQLARMEEAQSRGGLAPEGTTIGVAQRQFLRRQGIDPDAIARMGQAHPAKAGPAAMTPEQKQEKAAEQFVKAADKIDKAADKIARQEIVL